MEVWKYRNLTNWELVQLSLAIIICCLLSNKYLFYTSILYNSLLATANILGQISPGPMDLFLLFVKASLFIGKFIYLSLLISCHDLVLGYINNWYGTNLLQY